jgi:P4 family phage/plasmid primase-like protien
MGGQPLSTSESGIDSTRSLGVPKSQGIDSHQFQHHSWNCRSASARAILSGERGSIMASKRLDPMHLFPVKNGLLHLQENKKPELLAHDPSYWSLSAANYSYSRGDSYRNWEAFLCQIWTNDFEPQRILQEWFGYCLLRNTAQQKILTILGPPRSGKSTIARVLTELLGRSNVASPSIRSLSGQFGLWGLLDKSLAIVPDATLPKPCPALEELLKSISGEDSVDVHRKGMAPLTGVRLPTRLMLLANEFPAFHDLSGALDQRLIVLKTEKSFYGKEDIRLTVKLLTELPGILNWAIEGLDSLWRRGHFPDKASEINVETILDNVPDRNRVTKIVISYEKKRGRKSRPNCSSPKTTQAIKSSKRSKQKNRSVRKIY